jgi:RNA polymerase sigma-70 factor (ECF subfamily)
MTDRELADACRKGDREAWNTFVARFTRFIAFAARKYAGDSADEIVQNVFLALLKDDCKLWARYDPTYKITTWLGLLTRTQADRFRRSQPNEAKLLEEFAADVPKERALAPVLKGMQSLSPREQLLIRLFYEDGMTYKEIAEVTKMPVNTVGSHLLRARDTLKEAMAKTRSDI